MKKTNGGVCAPKGYKANGINCGIKADKSIKDLSLIVSDVQANAAGIYTLNLVTGAPSVVTQNHIT